MSQSKVLKVTVTTTREEAVGVSLVVTSRGDTQTAAILLRDHRVGDYAANPVQQGEDLARFLNDRLLNSTLLALMQTLHGLTGHKDPLDRN